MQDDHDLMLDDPAKTDQSVTSPISATNLKTLGQRLSVPRYQHGQISPGIAHIGVGNFHRAHQACYLDDLFNQQQAWDWGIVGIGLRHYDRNVQSKLRRQDWHYTVAELGTDQRQARIIGPMIDFLVAQDNTQTIIQQLADPAIRIVSLTITEGGYCLNSATGSFDPNHPDILQDTANPANPSGVFGVITSALKRRKSSNIKPFTVMSCDNILGNGNAARNAISGTAKLTDPGLAAWIEDQVAFPNAMVDRVTPMVTDDSRASIKDWLGIDDQWPVICEPFRQWVIEDKFCNGRPPLDKVGVTFTDDVAAFEQMKLRILNGGHAAIAYPAALLNIVHVHEAMTHPLISAYLQKLTQSEIIPIVPKVPGTDLLDYSNDVASRFANPNVKDTIDRLCQDGSDRQPKFILPSIRDRLDQGLPVDGLALETALWCRYCAGQDDQGSQMPVNDLRADALTNAARRARHEPSHFLALHDIFGDLGQHPTFSKAFANHLQSLWNNGTPATLQSYING